jgi:ADP-heptose:LPS heptosyltransferase
MRRSLVVSGEGIGNIIQSSAAISAFADIFEGSMELDVLLPGYDGVAPLLRGPHRVLTRPDRAADYAYLIPSWLMRGYAEKLCASRGRRPTLVPGGDPIKLDVPESEAHVRAVLEVAALEGMRPPPPELRTMCDYRIPGALKTLPAGGGPLVALHDGGNRKPFWRAKRYPRWQEVCDIVRARVPGVTFLVLGTKGDGSAAGERVIDLRGAFDLLETAGVLHEADLFVGNDTGLGHMAAALGTPACVVFGPTNVKKNLPPRNAFPIHETGGLPCRPCQRLGGRWRVGADGKRCRIECMSSLDPETVAEHVVDALKPPRRR